MAGRLAGEHDAALLNSAVGGECLTFGMDDEQLLIAVAEILWPDLRDLACRQHGHAPGHVCLPVSARADLDNVVETLSGRYGEPFAGFDRLPPLPLSGQVDWRYAWPFSNRYVAFGRPRQGEDAGAALMIALRGTPIAEQLPAEASWLERLVAVTGWVPRTAKQIDWVAVESRLGTPLPSDYKVSSRRSAMACSMVSTACSCRTT